MFDDAINSRAVSALPLSVGTSLAFESVFDPIQQPIDPDRKIPQHINLINYDRVYINVGTLFRNLYTSIDRSYHSTLDEGDLADAIAAEMATISDLFDKYTSQRVEVHYYHCSYDDIHKRFPFGILRQAKTDLQVLYERLYLKTMKILLKRSKDEKITQIYEYDSKFSNPSKRVLIITHFPIDLLNERKFKALDLLESHTGILKKVPEWYTKYFDGRDLNFLPFSGMLLTVFGDDHHFRPQGIKVKHAIIELAQQKKWNCLTFDSIIARDLSGYWDKLLANSILQNEHH